MQSLAIIIIVLIILLLLAAIYLFYMGLFKRIKIIEKEIGPYQLVYEEYIGDYSNTEKIADSIYSSLLADGVKTYRAFGIHYDDPRVIEKDKLRSMVGCIVEEKDYDKINALTNKYKMRIFEQKNRIVTDFPLRGRSPIFFSLLRVYPALDVYMKSRGYKRGEIMEIYDTPSQKITYAAEIIAGEFA
ncbi:MAG: hypothetical protein NTZ80_00995 [Patescibacteria group bacterium]|nr:hypothetical protein [Patescibacteria group bacterium]